MLRVRQKIFIPSDQSYIIEVLKCKIIFSRRCARMKSHTVLPRVTKTLHSNFERTIFSVYVSLYQIAESMVAYNSALCRVKSISNRKLCHSPAAWKHNKSETAPMFARFILHLPAYPFVHMLSVQWVVFQYDNCVVIKNARFHQSQSIQWIGHVVYFTYVVILYDLYEQCLLVDPSNTNDLISVTVENNMLC